MSDRSISQWQIILVFKRQASKYQIQKIDVEKWIFLSVKFATSLLALLVGGLENKLYDTFNHI